MYERFEFFLSVFHNFLENFCDFYKCKIGVQIIYDFLSVYKPWKCFFVISDFLEMNFKNRNSIFFFLYNFTAFSQFFATVWKTVENFAVYTRSKYYLHTFIKMLYTDILKKKNFCFDARKVFLKKKKSRHCKTRSTHQISESKKSNVLYRTLQ